LVDRKLTTILAADVTGYSRMMEQDEAATLATLRDYRAAMAGFIARHRGRVVNTAGDSLLAEFASVVEAVQCAVEIQRELAARNQALPPARQMQFRIGLNLGDVMVEGDDLFGEGPPPGCSSWPSPAASASPVRCSSRSGTS
jgi:adenylate cyclase